MIESTGHILGPFNGSLSALEDDLMFMASLCERSLRNSRSGLFARDSDLCNATIANDEEIDLLQKQVDKNGMDILVRFQPVASDLRHVVMAMKLSGNLEHIADKAVGIARKARQLIDGPELAEVCLMDPLYCEVTAMLDDALKAYAKSDLELAMSIPARDRKLDGLNHEVTEKLTSLMQKRPDRITGYLDLIFIARHLERAGDHVKEIAEDIVFALAAEDIRHLGDQRPRTLDELMGKRTRVTIRAADSLPS